MTLEIQYTMHPVFSGIYNDLKIVIISILCLCDFAATRCAKICLCMILLTRSFHAHVFGTIFKTALSECRYNSGTSRKNLVTKNANLELL